MGHDQRRGGFLRKLLGQIGGGERRYGGEHGRGRSEHGGEYREGGEHGRGRGGHGGGYREGGEHGRGRSEHGGRGHH